MTFPQTKLPLIVELKTGTGQPASAWTDITGDVYERDAIEITRGKANESGQAAPQSCRLTLDNRTGKYSPRNPVGAFAGPIGRNTQLRVGLQADAVYDAQSNASGTGDLSWTHTPVDTPTGVAVIVLQLGSSSHEVTSVTYGGVAMSQAYTILGVMGATPVWKAVYFLGRNIPDGAQTIAVDTTAATLRQAGAISVTGGTSSEIHNVASASGTGANPSVSLSLNQRALIFGGMLSSHDAVTDVSPGAGYTQVFETDLGTEVSNYERAVAQNPASYGVGWVAASADWTIFAVAIRATYSRFWGEVSSWPPRWDTSGNDAYAPIEVAGQLRRLGQGTDPVSTGLRNFMLSQTSNLFRYWPLDGAVGTQYSLDISPIWSAPTNQRFFSEGPGSFKYGEDMGSAYLGTGMALFHTDESPMRGNVGNGYPNWAMDFMFQSINLGGLFFEMYDYNGAIWVLELDGAAGTAEVSLLDPFLGSIGFSATGVLAALLDSNPHHVRFQIAKNGADTDWTLYIDGDLVDSGTQAGYEVYGMSVFKIRYTRTGTESWVNLAHLAVWVDSAAVVWPSATATAQAAGGYAGETAGERIERICGLADIDVTVIGDTADTSLMGPQYSESTLSQIRDAESTDLGVLTEPRDGLGLLYRTRTSQYNQFPAVTLDYSAGHLSPPFEPVDDDQLLRNDVTAVRREGDTYRITKDTGALSVLEPPNGVGRYRDEVTVNVETDALLPGVASWLLNIGTLDEARFPSIAVDMANPDVVAADITSQILAVEVGDVIAITNADNANIPDDISTVVLGYTERLNSFEHRIVFNCAPGSIYDTAVYGTSASVGADRYDTGGSTLAAGATSTATSLSVATAAGNALWTTDAAAFPFEINIAGERIAVTNVTGVSSPQTFTVARSINGVVKAQAADAEVWLWQTPRYAL